MQARSKVKFFFVLPGILWVLAFTIYPLIRSLRLSFTNARMGKPGQFVGLQNYIRAFGDYRFWNSAWITVFFVVCSVVFTVGLGLGPRPALQPADSRPAHLPLAVHHAHVHRPDRPRISGAHHIP